MHPDSLITDFLLAAARREGPAAELRCRAVLERAACACALHDALRRELACGGLTESGFKVLTVLRAREPEAVLYAAVATAAGLTPARTADALTRLEMSRLVWRQRDASDRRRVRLRLTAAGSNLVNDAVRRCVTGVVAVTESIDGPELTACLTISEKLRAGLTRLNHATPPPHPAYRS